MKAVLLCRVSSREQTDGFSLEAQKKLLIDYCERKELEVDHLFEFTESAKAGGHRKQFNQVVQYIKENKIPHLVVEKTDRIYRNFKDYVTIDEMKIILHLVKEGEVLDENSNSHTKLIHGFKVLLAKNYSENLGEEARKGQLERANSGWFPMRAPLGYLNNKDTREIDLNQESAWVIQDIYKLYLNDYSMENISEQLNAKGVNTRNGNIWYSSGVERILKNPFYFGDFLFKGKQYKGKHVPIITSDDWHHVQEKLKEKSKSIMKRKYYFAKKIYLNNQLLTGESKKRGRYIYYGRKLKNKSRFYISQEVIFNWLDKLINSISWSEIFRDHIKEIILEMKDKELLENKHDKKNAAKQIKKIENKLENLVHSNISDEIDRKTYQKIKFQLEEQLESWEEKLQILKNANHIFNEYICKIADNFHHLPKIYGNARPKEKVKILDTFIKRINVNEKKELEAVFNEPFSFFVEPKVLKICKTEDKSQLRKSGVNRG